MRAAEMEELIGLAEARGLVLMPGHLLLYHPAVQKLKELIDDGELGEVLVVYGNRQNLGKIRKDENALWSLGVHDLSVIQHLISTRRSSRPRRTATPSSPRASRTSSSATCASRPGRLRTCTCPGSTRTRCGASRSSAATRWPSSTTWSSSTRSPCTTRRRSSRPRRTASGGRARATPSAPKLSNAEPLRLECAHFVRLVQEGWDGREMRDGLEVVRALELLTGSLRGD